MLKASPGRPRAEAVLHTPTLAAVVKDPRTEYAYVEEKGAKASATVQITTTIYLYRFVKAAYCCDNGEILSKIRKNAWVVKSVRRHKDNPAWVSVYCDYQEHTTTPSSKPLLVTGSVVLALSPGEDWAIREIHVNGRTPTPVQSSSYVELTKTPDGYVPGKFLMTASSPGNKERREKNEWVLHEADAEPLPDSVFTLDALGAKDSGSGDWVRRWLFIGAGVSGVAILLLLVLRLYRSRTGVHSSPPPQGV